MAKKYFPDDNHVWVLKLCNSMAELQYYCANNGADFCSFEDAKKTAERGLRICDKFEESGKAWNEGRRWNLAKIIENCEERL